MATPIGTNTVTSISRRYIAPKIYDNVYGSNSFFYRMNQANKIKLQGGTQIEIPLMYRPMAAGGWYQGYQLLDVAPSDTIQNCALDWKQIYSPVTVDGLTLLRANSPLAIAEYIATQMKQAEMDMANNLGQGLWSDGTNTLAPDGVCLAVDNGTLNTTYAGLSRSSNPWWNAQVDSTTTTLSLSALQSMFGNVQSGGRAPTIIFSTQANYNRYQNLNLNPQQFPVQPGGKDMQLAQAGFENLLYNGVPWLVDNNIPTNTNDGNLFFLNEEYIDVYVSSRADFYVEDFQTPTNQDAMTSKLLWAGNIGFGNVQRQGKFTALAA